MRFTLLILLVGCASRVATPEVERDLVLTEDDCEGGSGFSASREDVRADLDVVERILREGWAGFDEREREGADWKKTFAALRSEVDALPDPVPLDALRKVVADGLAPAARDNHLAFWWVDARGTRHGSSAGTPHLDAWTSDGGVGEGAEPSSPADPCAARSAP